MVAEKKFDILNDEIDIQKLLSYLGANIYKILLISFLVSIFSFAGSYFFENRYVSKAVLAPSNSNTENSISNIAEKLGGIASLAGLNISVDSSRKDIIALEMLKSENFINRFVDRYRIEIPLMAGKKWDPKTDELILDSERYDENAKTWKENKSFLSQLGTAVKPTRYKIFKKFTRNLSVNTDINTQFTTIQLEFISPVLAKKWLDDLIEFINIEYRARESRKIEKNIAFLENQIQATKIAEMRAIFYSLIEEQTKAYMIAQSADEYVFTLIVDPVVADLDQKVFPRRAVFLVCGFLLGFIITIIYFIFKWNGSD